MSLTKEQTLSLANALVRTVRKYVPYSGNLELLRQAYPNDIRIKMNDDLESVITKNIPPYRSSKQVLEKYYEKSAKRTLLYNWMGYCDELVHIMRTLLKLTPIPDSEGTFFSLFFINAPNAHCFLLIHKGEFRHKDYWAGSLRNFCKDLKGYNTAICDPWIYLSTFGEKFELISNTIKDYKVEKYYRGPVKLRETLPFINKSKYLLSKKPNISEDEHRRRIGKYRDIFEGPRVTLIDFYEEEKKGPLKYYKVDSIKIQNSFEEFRNKPYKLPYRQSQLQNQLAEFIGVIVKVLSSQEHTDRKRKFLKKAMELCKENTKHNKYIEREVIENSLKTIIAFALIPNKISGNKMCIEKIRNFGPTKAGKEVLSVLNSGKFPELSKIIHPVYIRNYGDLLRFVNIEEYGEVYVEAYSGNTVKF